MGIVNGVAMIILDGGNLQSSHEEREEIDLGLQLFELDHETARQQGRLNSVKQNVKPKPDVKEEHCLMKGSNCRTVTDNANSCFCILCSSLTGILEGVKIYIPQPLSEPELL
ncbi:hypothetical protein CEXT_354221 [Caerostris extrusa]|uniref:Uncharacterized protein n=1 Tax=Caerostris extrusa TaxID=172846 RepID=A0AAV4URA9_CAEEX|nr:hypothetical protein CEXT_354221 [Caerostris extrusa]